MLTQKGIDALENGLKEAARQRTKPGERVVALNADEIRDWLAENRGKNGVPKWSFAEVPRLMHAHWANMNQMITENPVLSGQKVSNYLLDKLGMEQQATIDRWQAFLQLARDTRAADLNPTEYNVLANQVRELGELFGTSAMRTQSPMWVGGKMLSDPDIASLLRQGLTPYQATPPMRNILAGKFRDYMDEIRKAKKLTPAALLLSLWGASELPSSEGQGGGAE